MIALVAAAFLWEALRKKPDLPSGEVQASERDYVTANEISTTATGAYRVMEAMKKPEKKAVLKAAKDEGAPVKETQFEPDSLPDPFASDSSKEEN